MDIRNVTLKQKRYSTYGWNDRDVSGNYINTLSQGEIGILLGSNGQEVTSLIQGVVLDSILEVRIGSEDNQYFFDATVLSTNKPDVDDYCIKTFKTYTELPSFGNGNENSLYVVKDENAIYRWDDDAQPHWIRISGNDWHEIKYVDGNSSFYND